MSKLPKNDEKHDKAWEPADHFVVVYNLVPKQGDDEGAHGKNDDPCPAWYIWVDSMDELGSNNYIDRGPAEQCETTENCDLIRLSEKVLCAGRGRLLSFTP